MIHNTVSRRSIRRGAAMVLVLLGATPFAGCQSPETMGGLRLPGTPNLPGLHQAPTPQISPGGKTAAVRGAQTASVADRSNSAGHDSAGHDSAGHDSAGHDSAGHDFAGHDLAGPDPASDPVAQVGFIARLSDRADAHCWACQGCVQSDGCESCSPAYPAITLGRPVDPQEFLCNGGDLPPEARVLRDDSIGGLGPQDAIVHYTTEGGRIELQPSNTVCVYSPRFGAIRQISGAVAGEKAIGLNRTYQPIGPTGIGLTQPSLVVGDIRELAHADVARRVDAMRDRNRGVPVEGIVQPLIAEDVLQILATLDLISLNRLDESQIAVLNQGAVAAQSWMIRDAVEVMIESLTPPVLIRDAKVEAFVEYDFPDAGRLQIIKVADKDHAQQGEEVTFAIHVTNVGDSPVRNVEIADSLVTRLEYVEGSQKCDRQAEFDSAGNEAGSVRMKWSLADPLAVGETTKIEFKCRVR